jgi:hypothetical protein
MPRPFQGDIKLDVRDSTPDWDDVAADAYVDVERERATALSRD